MKWISICFLFFILVLFAVGVSAYSEEDLWLVGVIVNKDYTGGQVVEALITEDKVYLTLVQTANVLNIPLIIDNERRQYTFKRPGDEEEVFIDGQNQEIIVAGMGLNNGSKIYQINGKLYLDIDRMGSLMDADFEYNPSHLNIYIESKHIIKEEPKDYRGIFFRGERSKEGEEDNEKNTAFTLSNIKYKWESSWQKNESYSEEDSESSDWGYGVGDEEEDQKDEDWQTTLKFNFKGTVFNWKYNIDTSAYLEKDDELDLSLDKYILTYDMDKSRFQLGTLTVNTEEELILDDTGYYGVGLATRTSPVMRMSGNLIQVRGSAPEGSRVILYVNGWKMDIARVGDDKEYLFKDITLFENNQANELKIVIEKPSGEVEEVYRYITVSDAILNKGEVNYLAQVGRSRGDELEDDYYLVNTIGYWGATENITIGLGFYGEHLEDKSGLSFNYNSFRLNQRLNENSVFRSVFYRTELNEEEYQEDTGYRFNLDYQGKMVRTGVEYHKETEQFAIEEEKRTEPQRIIKVYFLRDISDDSLLEGKFTKYSKIDEPDERQDIYEAGYLIEKDQWKGSIRYKKNQNYYEKHTWQDNIKTFLSYLIRPNIELINEIGYKASWDKFLSESALIGLKTIIEVNEDTFLMGVKSSQDLDDRDTTTDYQFSWSRKWKVKKNAYLKSTLGYNHHNGEEEKQKIPLRLSYNHILSSDAKINLYYQNTWEKIDNNEDIEQRIGLSIEGAFNFFGGKLISTSPMAIGEKVGIVTGIVYRDSNHNGCFDEGEELLSGIPVRLGQRVKYTNEKGEFYFKMVPEGTYSLGFDFEQLPIELTPVVPEKTIKLKANGEVKEDLGLYVVGAVDGIVSIKNSNKELSLNEIKITAEPGGYTATTDHTGYYFFDLLPIGEYKISLDQNTIPKWFVLETVEPYRIEITETGEYISDLDFTLKIKPGMTSQLGQDKVDDQVGKINKVEVIKKSEPDNIKVIEERLLEITDQVLKIDKENEKAYYQGKEFSIAFLDNKDNKLWTPLRKINKIFGARVFWDNELKKIYVVDEKMNILFDIRLGQVIIDGEIFELEDGLLLKEGHNYITLEDLGILGFFTEVKDNIIYIYKRSKIKE